LFIFMICVSFVFVKILSCTIRTYKM
jgi:hypothetical protein